MIKSAIFVALPLQGWINNDNDGVLYDCLATLVVRLLVKADVGTTLSRNSRSSLSQHPVIDNTAIRDKKFIPPFMYTALMRTFKLPYR